jgi:hypothetical protein
MGKRAPISSTLFLEMTTPFYNVFISTTSLIDAESQLALAFTCKQLLALKN